jgi:MFS transporter
MMFALVMLLIVAVVLILSEETKGRTLEDING